MTSQEKREIRQLLPASASRRTPIRIIWMSAHALLVFLFIWLSAQFFHWWIVIPAVALASHSLLCLGFLTHDLSHGSILGSSIHRTFLEKLFWAINMIPQTIWKRVHNETHHLHFGTPHDPDRRFLETEASLLTKLYTTFLIPNRDTIVGNPLVVIQLFFYTTRNIVAAFYRQTSRPSFVPAKPDYKKSDQLWIICDLLLIVAIQIAFFVLVECNAPRYIVTVLTTYVITSGLSMLYIFTNHSLISTRLEAHPVEGSTSIIVPRIFDTLHSYFSYHTEHHIFPNLNPKYYPALSRILEARYPLTYRRIPMFQAWRDLWQRPMFDPDPRISSRKESADFTSTQ